MLVDDVLCFLTDCGISSDNIEFKYHGEPYPMLPETSAGMNWIFLDAILLSNVLLIEFGELDTCITVDFEEVMARYDSFKRDRDYASDYSVFGHNVDFNSAYPNILDSPD